MVDSPLTERVAAILDRREAPFQSWTYTGKPAIFITTNLTLIPELCKFLKVFINFKQSLAHREAHGIVRNSSRGAGHKWLSPNYGRVVGPSGSEFFVF